MKHSSLSIALAIMACFVVEANAATACVQNKTTGRYEARPPSKTGVDECAAFNRNVPSAAPSAGPSAVKETAEEMSLPSVEIAPPKAPAVAKASIPVPEQTWEIRTSDGSVRAALSRWAENAKPQRQLVFDIEDNDFPTTTEAIFTGDFDTAILEVMKSLQNSRYPVRACLWENKPRPVVKIIHKNKRCQD